MRNDRSIPSEDTIIEAVPIIITGRHQDTIIITARHQDTIIVSITIILIHTATAFGFFGGATRTRWGFQATSSLFKRFGFATHGKK
jgi:hypothetical protein